MKDSAYNIFSTDADGKSLVFDAYTRRFFRVSEKNTHRLREIIADIDRYTDVMEYAGLCSTLRDNGFVIDDNKSEYDLLYKSFEAYRTEPAYTLLVMTSYACNFSCWYCVQKHKSVALTVDAEEKIRSHIARYLHDNEITSFNLSWFGGEPLLNYDSIYRLSYFAAEYCRDNDIDFMSSITTNGSLLTKEMISEMSGLNFRSFQITLDGNKHCHNATRYNATISDSFSLILHNIYTLCDIIPEANVIVRINYTKDNLDEIFVAQIDTVLAPFRDRVQIMFRKVWQEKFSDKLSAKVGTIMEDMVRRGYKVFHDFDNPAPCYVEKAHYHAVFPDGTVDRCSNVDMSRSRGVLLHDGSIRWNVRPQECDTNIFTAESECRRCKYLPLCFGPCPKRRMVESKKNGCIRCQYEDKDSVFASEILNYVRIKEAAI